MDLIFTTEAFHSVEFITEPISLNLREFITEKFNETQFITEQVNLNIIEFITESFNQVEFITEDSDFISSIKSYPTWLELMREEAISTFYDEIVNLVKTAFLTESYGKKDICNYDLSIKFNLLIDYLSIISRNMRTDEIAEIEREEGYQYYYKLYNLDTIISNFRKQDLNIKPLLSIFRINEYLV